jgi:hypothetical protein
MISGGKFDGHSILSLASNDGSSSSPFNPGYGIKLVRQKRIQILGFQQKMWTTL